MASPIRRERHTIHLPEDYFRGVSPLCRRILDDMARVRDEFGEQWPELTYEEQCKILDQTIVDEATVRRYETEEISGPDCEYFPKLKLSTGQKIVSDEKLSARGYSCSWRDEHSAPFSFLTQSQMNLTYETPPPTPTQPEAPSVEFDIKSDYTETLPKCDVLRDMPMYPKPVKSSPFHWHYDHHPDVRPPDPPDLVLASSLTRNDLNGSSTLIAKGPAFNHLVVRADVGQESSFKGWFRGAISAITGTCIPIHTCGGSQNSSQLHPGSPFIHPELRPPHVIAKAAKISLPTINQPKKSPKLSNCFYRLPKESTLTSEYPSTETSLTYDATSDIGSHTYESEVVMRNSQNLNNKSLYNRNSLKYGTFAEEESFDEQDKPQYNPSKLINDVGSTDNHRRKDGHLTDNQTNHGKFKADNIVQDGDLDEENNCNSQRTPSNTDILQENVDVEEDLPLLSLSTNNENYIPKTGFDFLDNW